MAAAGNATTPATTTTRMEEEDDDDDMPLAARAKQMVERAKAAKRKRKDDEEAIMLKKHALGLRAKPTQTNAIQNTNTNTNTKNAAGGGGGAAGKKKNKTKKLAPKQEKQKVTKRAVKNGDDPEPKWHTLEHNGVVFPDLYTPHGIRPLYAGQALELNAEEEEVRDANMSKVYYQCGSASQRTNVHISSRHMRMLMLVKYERERKRDKPAVVRCRQRARVCVYVRISREVKNEFKR